MKQYLLGLFNGIMIFIIFGSFVVGNYILGTILCFITVTSIFLVMGNISNYIKLKREARKIEDIINFGRDEINKEFRGNKL